MQADFHMVKSTGKFKIFFYDKGYRCGSIELSPEKFNAMWELFNYESKEKYA